MSVFGLRCIFVKSFHSFESLQPNVSNKIFEGWRAVSSGASAGAESECFFEVTAAELQVVGGEVRVER